MNVISVIWQISFISMLVAFGIEIGLSSGLSKLSKRSFTAICCAYCGGIFLLTEILSLFPISLSGLLSDYITVIYGVMAIVMIVGAFKIIQKYKNNDNIFDCVKIAHIITIPCCIFSMAINIMVIEPTIDLSINRLNLYSCILLLVIMVICYLASKYIKMIKKPYPILLSNYMLIFGEYFIFTALFLPNISTALQKTSNITIYSTEYMFMFIIIIIGLIVFGLLLNARKSLLK
ncbi:MAG: DUF2162 family putative transporter [Methanosphaera sp.]|nr:DUF2162 family putative transporter [Methanosphaera sp.]